MSTGYTIVARNDEMYYVEDAPVILKTFAITKDEQTGKVLLQCKFENLASDKVVSIQVSVKCFSIDMIPQEGVKHFAYMDLYANKHAEFGDTVPVYLPNTETRNVEISLKKIVFSGGQIWQKEGDTRFKKLDFQNTPITALAPLDEQYKRELETLTNHWIGHSALPEEKGIFMRCGCGKVLLKNELRCPLCGIDIEKLLKIQDKDLLFKHQEEFNENQLLEQQQKEEEERRKKKRNKKIIKIIIVAVLVAVAALAAGYGILTALYGDDYDKACDAFKNEEYEAAQEMFSDINPLYKDTKAWNNLFEYLTDRGISMDDTKKIRKIGQIKHEENEGEFISRLNRDIYGITNFEFTHDYESAPLERNLYIADFAIENPGDAKKLVKNEVFYPIAYESFTDGGRQLWLTCVMGIAYNNYSSNDNLADELLTNLNLADELYSIIISVDSEKEKDWEAEKTAIEEQINSIRY